MRHSVQAMFNLVPWLGARKCVYDAPALLNADVLAEPGGYQYGKPGGGQYHRVLFDGFHCVLPILRATCCVLAILRALNQAN